MPMANLINNTENTHTNTNTNTNTQGVLIDNQRLSTQDLSIMALNHNKHTAKYLLTKQFYNGFQNVFPKGICEIILDMYFGRIARVRWYNSRLHDNIKECYHKKFFEWLDKNTSYKKRPTFLKNNKEFLKIQIPISMKRYYDCECCLRHQVLKPYIFENELFMVTKLKVYDDTGFDIKYNCYCACRHLARNLARDWMEIINIEKERETDYERDFLLLK